MKRRIISTLVWICFNSFLARAQESLTNDSVIKLAKAGLSENLVVQTVNS